MAIASHVPLLIWLAHTFIVQRTIFISMYSIHIYIFIYLHAYIYIFIYMHIYIYIYIYL